MRDRERRHDNGSNNFIYMCLRVAEKDEQPLDSGQGFTARDYVYALDWDLAKHEDIVVLCGEGCASALFSRSLGEWKKPVQKDNTVEFELAVA